MTEPSRQAVVLAGGLGMRLRPYTAVLPKPLMPIGDRPVLDIVVRQLRHAGFGRLTISTGYLAQLIETFFRAGDDYGITIDYFREKDPLGTVGSLAFLDLPADAPFLVMNGDVITDLDYRELYEGHRRSGAIATIATLRQDHKISLGVLKFHDPEEPERVTGYEEKPELVFHASMGVYCFSPAVLGYIERGERLDFPDLVLRMVAAGEFVRGWQPGAYWLDIGRHEDYETAMQEFEQWRHKILPPEA